MCVNIVFSLQGFVFIVCSEANYVILCNVYLKAAGSNLLPGSKANNMLK